MRVGRAFTLNHPSRGGERCENENLPRILLRRRDENYAGTDHPKDPGRDRVGRPANSYL